jgi:hypothetical protein
MTTPQIIAKFHLYCGDQSELSSSDELDLANSKYDDVMNEKPWQFLKKEATGSITPNGTGAYITIPTDFRYFIENNLQTDNSETIRNNASPKVVYVGVNYAPYQIINWSDRREYTQNGGNYCYYDSSLGRIVFPVAPGDMSLYSFDYIKQWVPLTQTGSDPIIQPVDCAKIIFFGMCLDSTIINLFDRSHSYDKENQQNYADQLTRMKYHDAMQQMN